MNIASPLTINASKQKIWIRASVLWGLGIVFIIIGTQTTPVLYVFGVIAIIASFLMVKYRSGAHVVVDHEGVKTYNTQNKFQLFPFETIHKVMRVDKFSMFDGQLVQAHRAVVFFDTENNRLGYVWGSFYANKDLDALFMAFNEIDRIERKDGGQLTRP